MTETKIAVEIWERKFADYASVLSAYHRHERWESPAFLRPNRLVCVGWAALHAADDAFHGTEDFKKFILERGGTPYTPRGFKVVPA